MIGTLWSGLATVAAPGLRALLRRRARLGKEQPGRLGEREGHETAPRPPGQLVWLHAASVGESQSVLPVVDRLLLRPDVSVLITTGTVTSAALLEGQMGRFAGRLLHRFAPWDVPRWAANFLDHWRPEVAGFVESELWPNLLAASARRGTRLMLVNGRMSARSYRGWQRVPSFARRVVGAFDTVHPQSAEDAERLRALGAKAMEAPGNLKFAAAPLPADEAALAALRAQLGARPAWLAASTHAGEEDAVAAAHRSLAATSPGLLTIIAPRHPARGEALAAALSAPRRAAGQGPPEAGGIWIADTMGELGLLYRLAPIVFVGRSLGSAQGGQNPLEPARLGCAVATGPHTANFTGPVAKLQAAGGLTVVEDAAALAAWARAMLHDPARRTAAGHAAEAVANGEADLPERIARRLLELAA